MSSLHPHWQATDDGAAVPVRIAPSKTTPTNIPVGTKSVSRRPAAVVGMLMAFSIGAVAYGTLDDTQPPLSGELMNVENPMTYLDVLGEEIAEQSAEQSADAWSEGLMDEWPEEDVDAWEQAAEVSAEESAFPAEDLAQSIPEHPRTFDVAPVSLSVSLPVNQNTIGANVTESFHSGAPIPLEQPQTGAGMLWITILGAVMGMIWRSKEILKAYA